MRSTIATGTTHAAVTGYAAITPLGNTMDQTWSALIDGNRAVGVLDRFDNSRHPTRCAGLVHDLDVAAALPGRLAAQTDIGTHYGLIAAHDALAHASATNPAVEDLRSAVVTASSSGGVEFGQREMENLWVRGPKHVTAYQSIAWFYAATTGQVSIRHGLGGENAVLVSEQAGGLDTFGHAMRAMSRDTDQMVVGGYESCFSPYGLTCLESSGLLSDVADPTRAYLPFSADARGYVPAEGAAMVVCEPEEAVRNRGGVPLATITGQANTFDPPPWSGRGSSLASAIRGALNAADLRSTDIDLVLADGAAVVERDDLETEAIAEVFGPRAVPVAAPKAAFGRMAAAAGALDVLFAVYALSTAIIPGTDCGTPSETTTRRIDLVSTPTPAQLRNVLVLARGWGGFNSALIVRGANPSSDR